MLNRIADLLGYKHPCYSYVNRGGDHRCIVDFSSVIEGGRNYSTFGRFCSSTDEATKSAMYNTLLAFCVNHKLDINDTNRPAYTLLKESVQKVSSDIEVLGNMGSTICTYLDRTRRGLEMMMTSYSDTLICNPCGEQLVGKLQGIVAKVEHCLAAITGPVRSMNENLVVGLLEF
jgi:hypothetical protein